MNSDMTKYCYQHFENAYNIGWNVNFDSTAVSYTHLTLPTT